MREKCISILRADDSELISLAMFLFVSSELSEIVFATCPSFKSSTGLKCSDQLCFWVREYKLFCNTPFFQE